MRFAPVEGWGTLPDGWRYVEVAGVAVDSRDRVFCFTRGEHPVIVFDRDGHVPPLVGRGRVRRAHGITIDADDTVWLTDDLHHTVRKFTPEGKLLLTIGNPDTPADLQGGKPFNRPTHVAICPRTGSLFISDGYGNSRVHKYAPDGRTSCRGASRAPIPASSTCPHNIATDSDGLVYVADRENHRVQIFDGEGRFQGAWNNAPSSLRALRGQAGTATTSCVGELGPACRSPTTRRTSVRASPCSPRRGSACAASAAAGESPGEFNAPHAVVTDSRGDLYVARGVVDERRLEARSAPRASLPPEVPAPGVLIAAGRAPAPPGPPRDYPLTPARARSRGRAGSVGEMTTQKRRPRVDRPRGRVGHLRLVVPPAEAERGGEPRVGSEGRDLPRGHDAPLQGEGVARDRREPAEIVGLGGAEVALGGDVHADQPGDAHGNVRSDQRGAHVVMPSPSPARGRGRLGAVVDEARIDGEAPHVVEEAGQHQLLIRARRLGEIGALQRVRQLGDRLAPVLARGGGQRGEKTIGHAHAAMIADALFTDRARPYTARASCRSRGAHLDDKETTTMAVTVKAIENGPLMVDGECQVIDAQGNTLPSKGDKTFLCRCGSSANKPYCDGTHKTVAFKS